jgi:chemotaxis protein CheZ
MQDASTVQTSSALQQLTEFWQNEFGDQQAQWLESYEYLFEQSQQTANTVLEVCEQLQFNVDDGDQATHVALQKIMQAQEFADLHGQILNRLTSELRSQHEKMREILGEYRTNSDDDAEQRKQGMGPNISRRSKQDSVSSQQEADDLLAQLGL